MPLTDGRGWTTSRGVTCVSGAGTGVGPEGRERVLDQLLIDWTCEMRSECDDPLDTELTSASIWWDLYRLASVEEPVEIRNCFRTVYMPFANQEIS